SDSVYDYICRIIAHTRDTEKYGEILYGASPRASLALLKTSKVIAALEGRSFVIPEDIKQVAHGVLRHRIILNYEALAEGISTDDMIEKILGDTIID
ncbi:AAA family ATPase, partial [Candidatus Gracilibacteria bacterium]|nr:AAA family ATPase [Candidatus Gracilibacteria bacterium]